MIVFKGGKRAAKGYRTGLGTSFAKLVSYLERSPADADRVAWAATRNLDTDLPDSAARIMTAHAGEAPRVELPVYHFGLSLDAGEHLSQEQWEQAIGRVLARMGLADHQALLVAHHDTGKEHVHVVVNRVGDDLRAWKPRLDMKKAREEVRRLVIGQRA